MKFRLLDGELAVTRLDPDALSPSWAVAGEFVSITRTAEELSVVCPAGSVPAGLRTESGWRCLQLIGPIPFEQTGVAAAFLAPLAGAGISVFVISTYDTDYLLVKETRLADAVNALRSEGYAIV